MKSPSEVKARAVKLREVLSDMGHKLKHSDSLEIISKFEGYPDWNTYTAELAKGQQTAEEGLDDTSTETTITLPDPTKMPEEGKLVYCSFCGRSQQEVRKLIAGPSVFICDVCVDLCNDIITEERGS